MAIGGWLRAARLRRAARGSRLTVAPSARLRRVRITAEGRGNHIVIGPGVLLENVHIYMRGSGHSLVVAEGCHMTGGSFWFEDYGCAIRLGRRTSVQSAHLAATEPNSQIEIGVDCMLAYDIDIRTGDSHSILDSTTGERINYAQDVVIGDGVWIGAHVSVLKGAAIGSGSVIATRSVVTGTLPSACVAAGSPATVVRSGVRWMRRRLPDPRTPPPRTAEMADTWYQRAMAWREAGRSDVAAEEFGVAAELRPGHTDTHYHWALALFEAGHPAEALAEYERALSLGPVEPWMWFDRGVCLARLGRDEEALRSYRRALRMRPDYRQAWFEKARAHTRLGQPDDALECLMRAVRLHPAYLPRVRTEAELAPLYEETLRRLGRSEREGTVPKNTVPGNMEAAEMDNVPAGPEDRTRRPPTGQ